MTTEGRIAILRDEVAQRDTEVARLRAEVERLRVALRELIEVVDHPDTPHVYGLRVRLRDARAALGEEP